MGAVRIVRDTYEDVLDLSISLRTGEETNVDFCSSGERTRKSPSGKPLGVVVLRVGSDGKRCRIG